MPDIPENDCSREQKLNQLLDDVKRLTESSGRLHDELRSANVEATVANERALTNSLNVSTLHGSLSRLWDKVNEIEEQVEETRSETDVNHAYWDVVDRHTESLAIIEARLAALEEAETKDGAGALSRSATAARLASIEIEALCHEMIRQEFDSQLRKALAEYDLGPVSETPMTPQQWAEWFADEDALQVESLRTSYREAMRQEFDRRCIEVLKSAGFTPPELHHDDEGYIVGFSGADWGRWFVEQIRNCGTELQ